MPAHRRDSDPKDPVQPRLILSGEQMRKWWARRPYQRPDLWPSKH